MSNYLVPTPDAIAVKRGKRVDLAHFCQITPGRSPGVLQLPARIFINGSPCSCKHRAVGLRCTQGLGHVDRYWVFDEGLMPG